jgi:hypothetical protein
MDISIEYISDYRNTDNVNESFVYRFLLFLKKVNISKSLADYLKKILLKKLYKKWDYLGNSLDKIPLIVETLNDKELEELQVIIQDVMYRTIDINESLENINFIIGDYQVRYKTMLSKFNNTNNLLHKMATKNTPIERTPESLREGLSSLGSSSISQSLSK